MRVVTDLAEKRRAIDLLHAHYDDVRENYSVADAKLEKVVNVLAIEITSLTGKTKGYPNPDNPKAVVVKKAEPRPNASVGGEALFAATL